MRNQLQLKVVLGVRRLFSQPLACWFVSRISQEMERKDEERVKEEIFIPTGMDPGFSPIVATFSIYQHHP